MRCSPQNPATESASGEASRSQWNVALDTVAEAIAFENVVHVPFSQGKASVGLIGKCFDPKSEVAVIDHWRQCHLSARRIAELSRKAVLGSGDYRKPEERRGCGLYQTPCCEQIFEHENFPYFTGVKVTAGDEPWCLVLERSAEKGPFSRTELKRLGQFSSFLSTAASEIHSIGIAQAEAILAILDVLAMPAAWVDECGCMRSMNQEAERLFQGAEVTCRHGKIVCSDRAVRQRSRSETFSVPPCWWTSRFLRPACIHPARRQASPVACLRFAAQLRLEGYLRQLQGDPDIHRLR